MKTAIRENKGGNANKQIRSKTQTSKQLGLCFAVGYVQTNFRRREKRRVVTYNLQLLSFFLFPLSKSSNVQFDEYNENAHGFEDMW